MFSSIKTKLANIIKTKIIQYSSKKGIIINIEEVMFSCINLNFKKVTIFTKAKNAIIKLDNLSFRFFFWRSLCNLYLVGKLDFNNLSSNWNIISDKIFIINHLDIIFKLRNKNKIILNFETNNISSLLLLKKTKKNIELYFDLPSITWDIIIEICHNHFYFQYL